MNKIFKIIMVFVVFGASFGSEFSAAEINSSNGATSKSNHKVTCGARQEFYEGEDYYCIFPSAGSTLVWATLANNDSNSTAAGKANVWLRETDGIDSTVCSWNNVYLKPGHYMKCEGRSASSNFHAHGKYTDLDGKWESVRSNVS